MLDKNFDCENEYFLLFLPFYHIFGIGVVMSTLLQGGTGVFMQAFKPKLFCSSIQKYRVKFKLKLLFFNVFLKFKIIK